MIEVGINQEYKIVNYLDKLKTDCTHRLYSWDIVKIVKAYLIKE